MYFQVWNVGMACGTNALPGCRDAAVDYTTKSSFGFQPNEAEIIVTIGLVGDDGKPVDLRVNELAGLNYSQVNGICARPTQEKLVNTVALTLRPEYQVLAQGGGCLEGRTNKTAPRAFAVAHVKLPPASGLFGGLVKGCPDGVCIVGLNAPPGAAQITHGADEVARVCGEARRQCTIAAGDWNFSPQQSITDRWNQLINTGQGGGGIPRLSIQGPTDSATVTALDTPGAMNVGEGFPLQSRYPNATGQAHLADLLVPCQFPDNFPSGGCLR